MTDLHTVVKQTRYEKTFRFNWTFFFSQKIQFSAIYVVIKVPG